MAFISKYGYINVEIDDTHSIECTNPNGIPLTSEILEKNGFVKSNNVSDTKTFDRDEDGNMHFNYENIFWGWWQQDGTFLIPANGMEWINLKHVHELQHVLKLCEIDKEIKL